MQNTVVLGGAGHAACSTDRAATAQVWIIKIVVSFWTALGQIPEQRRSELLDLKEAVQMVYW